MRNIWTKGGLPIRELLYRTAYESWKDAVFGQGGRMAFYHFLAIFPSLFLFLAISARVPGFGNAMKNTLQEVSSQVLPSQASQLLQQTIDECTQRGMSGLQLASACAGALWAALNGTWAMVYGLNKAYEVEEHRPWWKLALTISGLTLSLAIAGSVAVFLIFCGKRLLPHLYPAAIALRTVEWLILCALLLLSFGILYRFAPNLRDHEWRWSTPGAITALLLWVGSTVAVRYYFEHFNDYTRSYGHLNGVVMLLLWLYVSNGAILIGGEMNSEIEKAAAARIKGSGGIAGRKDRSGS